jgi:hypothetical protein
MGEEVIETGFGQKWPARERSQADYIMLANSVGFRLVQTEQIGILFHLHFIKD